LRRSAPYWDGWVARYWGNGSDNVLLVSGDPGQETGYALAATRPQRSTTYVVEMRARDAGAEEELLRAAARLARGCGQATLGLSLVPQHVGDGALEALGSVSETWHEGLMLRAITLDPGEMARVRDAYTTGAAQLWWADDF
jgi:hypothetical protein